MIFLSNAAGEITAAIPETINQGSVGVNKIVLIAPFPANSVVSATFTLPNGIKIYPRYVDGVREENYPYLMGVVEAFGDEGLVIDGVTVNAWQLTLDKAITQIAGKVTVQFLITTASGGVTEGGGEVGILPGTEFVLATTSATLPINRGNAYISPSVAPSQFELIEQYLAAAKLAEENAKTSANTAEEFYMDASDEADRAAAEADRAKLEADRYSPWDVVSNQETALAVLNGMANTSLKSYLFLNVDFTKLNLNSFINGDGIPQITIANSIEKLEFRGCTFESAEGVPLALKFFYQGSQCSINGAKGDELVIQGFTDVIDCRAKLIQGCEYVTACDAVTLDDCESVTDTTAETFTNCIFVDPFTVIGFVPSKDVGKVATLTDDGTYKPERLTKTIRANVDPDNYKIKIAIDDVNGIEMSEAEIDLPLESVVVGATVSDDGSKLILTLQNGNTVDVPIGDIFRGVATEEYVNDTVGQAIENLQPYDVATEEVYLDYQQAYLKLTIDNLLDRHYKSFQPFDMVCVGNDEYPLSSICTVTVESYDAVKMLVYNTEGAAETLCPKYHTNEDGNVYLYFSIAGIKHFQVFIRGLVEKCTGATLEIVDALPTYPLDIYIEKHLNEDYVTYTEPNGTPAIRPIGSTPLSNGIVCRNEDKGIEVRSLASGETYADNEAVPFGYIRDTMFETRLEEYVKFTDYASYSRAGVVKVASGYGVGAYNSGATNGLLYIFQASESDIDEKKNQFRPIVPANLEYAVKSVTYDKAEIDAKVAAGGGGGNANIDVTAEVGQTIIVKEVDANGKPTKWESADYQERICWTDETVILPETTAEVVDDEELGATVAFLPEFTLVAGDRYTVKYNGVEYVCECVGGGESFFIGNLGVLEESLPVTGEPFIIASEGGVQFLFPFDGATTVTLSIAQVDVNPIPQKYVTNAFPYYVDVTVEYDTSGIPKIAGYSTTETISNLTTLYESGRPLIAKAVFTSYQTSGNPLDTRYYPLSAAYNSAPSTIYTFVNPTAIASSQNHLILYPRPDGGYEVSGSTSVS